jgi:hypothetical protein
LPGSVGITEESLDRQIVQCQVAGELGAVVEGDALAQRVRQGSEQADEMARDAMRSLAGKAHGQQQARGPFMHGEDGLTVF